MDGGLRGGPTVEVVPPERFGPEGARRVAEVLSRRVADAGRATLGLSGGSTPEPLYRSLARHDVPWDRITVYLADERHVPVEHPDSNQRAVRTQLLGPAGVPEENVRFPAPELDDVGEVASRYAAVVPPALDVLLLGVGEDGHTASLFPDGSDWTGSEARALATRSPRHEHARVSLGPSVIRRSGTVVLARGRRKRDAVARALERGPAREVPARLARSGLWLLDEDAAPGGGPGEPGDPHRES